MSETTIREGIKFIDGEYKPLNSFEIGQRNSLKDSVSYTKRKARKPQKMARNLFYDVNEIIKVDSQ